MRPFTPEELEPGSERVARLFGAAAWSGVAGYVFATLITDKWPSELFLAMVSTGPLLGMLFSLPRCPVASYFGRGLLAVVFFALFFAVGQDHDPLKEETPALTFIVTFYLGFFLLLGGLAGLVAVKVLGREHSTDS